MGDSINIEKNCNSLGNSTLRRSCESLSRECLDQNEKNVREYTLERPDGTLDIETDLKSCLEAAREIPATHGPSPHIVAEEKCTSAGEPGSDRHSNCVDMVAKCAETKEWPTIIKTTQDGHTRNSVLTNQKVCFRLAEILAGNGHRLVGENDSTESTPPKRILGNSGSSTTDSHHESKGDFSRLHIDLGPSYQFTQIYSRNGTTTYNGEATQLSVGIGLYDDSFIPKLFFRHSILGSFRDGTEKLQSFQTGLELEGASYPGSGSIGLHFMAGAGVNFYHTKTAYSLDLPNDDNRFYAANMEPGITFNVSSGLSVLDNALKFVISYQRVQCTLDHKHDNGVVQTIPYNSNNLLLGITTDLPFLWATNKVKDYARKKGEEGAEEALEKP